MRERGGLVVERHPLQAALPLMPGELHGAERRRHEHRDSRDAREDAGAMFGHGVLERGIGSHRPFTKVDQQRHVGATERVERVGDLGDARVELFERSKRDVRSNESDDPAREIVLEPPIRCPEPSLHARPPKPIDEGIALAWSISTVTKG